MSIVSGVTQATDQSWVLLSDYYQHKKCSPVDDEGLGSDLDALGAVLSCGKKGVASYLTAV